MMGIFSNGMWASIRKYAKNNIFSSIITNKIAHKKIHLCLYPRNTFMSVTEYISTSCMR